MKPVVKTSDIKVTVGLDEDNIPVDLKWLAEDGNPTNEAKDAKGMLLSLFDAASMDTFKIDLWTTELQVNEMDRFMYQTLRGLADTYFKATKNTALANDMQKFTQYFGEQTELIKKEEDKK